MNDNVHRNKKSVEKLKELQLSSTCEPDPLLKVNKELATLKFELSGLRTDVNTTIQKVEDLSANPYLLKATTIENKMMEMHSYNITYVQEAIQKVDTKQLTVSIEMLKNEFIQCNLDKVI